MPDQDAAVTRWRKKPVVIDARQFDGTAERGAEICAWANGAGAQAEYHPFLADHFKCDPKFYMAHLDPYMRIVTLEGTMIASPGDWIIKGVRGEFYPCKPDTFEETYERDRALPDRDPDAPAAAAPDPLLDSLCAEIYRQDAKHGRFSAATALGRSRLAIACLEDEIAEVKDAWRSERRVAGWEHTEEELLQVAAVALRALRDLQQEAPDA